MDKESRICEGDNDNQEVDQTEMDIPTEASEICEGAEITAQRLTSEIREVENHDKVVIQLLTSEIPASAKKAESLSSACIYRVPEVLRNLNKSAYTPRLIAIGPLHRNDEHLKTPMQDVKISYMNNLLCRLPGMENPKKKSMVLGECMAEMKASLDDAKKCYAEEVTLDEKMMLIDGCFILEFLYRLYLRRNHPKYFFAQMGRDDPIFVNDSTFFAVQKDLVLLENQIPFLVLEKLYALTLARIHNNMSLNDFVVLPLVHRLMRPTTRNSTNSGSAETSCWPSGCCILWVSKTEEKVPSEDEAEEEVSSGNGKCYHHILHKIHDDYLPRDKKKKGKEDAAEKETGKGELIQTIPCASELVYAGVKFERGTENDLFQVKFIEPKGPFYWFRSARFEIPPLDVDDDTELFLRNFIALEQCCSRIIAFEQCPPRISRHFTSFAHLMDMLVNSDIDVQVLQKAGVVDNWLGASDDITVLFNNLVKEVIGGPLYADMCNRATRYSKWFWPKNKAYLKAQYFASPWKFIAFCLGIVYFVITIIQFIISVTPSVLNWLVLFGFQYNF